MSDLQPGLMLAKTIAESALWHGDECAFQGATAGPELGQPGRWRVFGGDFYEGSAGIARLLALAATLGGDETLRRTAHGAIRHALNRPEGWSLHSGAMGTGLVAIEIADHLGAPDIAGHGLALCADAMAQALDRAEDAPFDLLSGLAGVVLGAVMLARHQPSGDWLSCARPLAERLAEAARPDYVGLNWPMQPGDPTALCGLAHGAAGVAMTFEALAATDPEHRDAGRWCLLADEARVFERMHFDDARLSWVDLREDAQTEGAPKAAPHFWCHGSVGIAHDRMFAFRQRPLPLLASDLSAALAGARREALAIANGPAGPAGSWLANGSLCHGVAGFIDLFCATGQDHDLQLARRLAGFMENDARRPEGPRCGIPSGETTPGLMLGQAGIAWGHLRAARPGLVPLGWLPGAEIAAFGGS